LAKQKSYQKFIYKLQSKRLKKAKWKLNLPLSEAMKNKNDIVSLNDSQILRWIDELNGNTDSNTVVKNIQKQIKIEKKKPKSQESRNNIKKLYQELYNLQYQKDYNCLIMNSNKEYDKANEGYSINEVMYRRFIGTNGGIKKSTVVYVNNEKYDVLKERMNNGRNMLKEIVPAKLEAYQALICSGSTPVTPPKGIIVVNDCIVNFTDNVIKLDDSKIGEPQMDIIENYPIEYMDSDGYGLMTPEYSKTLNKDLYGEEYADKTLSGVNTRYAWTKGMLFTFDYIKFAEEKVNKNYMILDAWGDYRDVRESQVILTTSMLKLWDSYKNWEDYYNNCEKNHYQFSVSKATPHELENVRNANYQFLQSYKFTDEELYALCKPTIDEINDTLGMDYRKSIVFLKGMYLDEDNIDFMDNDFIKALMINKNMIDDPFVLSKIHGMIKKRINIAAKGSIKLNGNFAIVCGDPYSLAQSIFGLEITGLLKEGQIYHKYWSDKGVKEVSCFRAPMTCHNNIRKRNVTTNDEMDNWYQHIETGLILNSWDTTCDALNGMDKDSDTVFSTDNEIIVKNTLNSPTIQCIQRKAPKIIPTEEDLVQANKLAFGDEIGQTTNNVTGEIEVQAGFKPESEEYQVLEYRIMCGQLYQQNAIDKSKGIIAKSMPREWYDKSANKILQDDDSETRKRKEFNLRIVADKKPYFMKYVYPKTMSEYNDYIKNTNKKCVREFQMTMKELLEKPNKTITEKDFVDYYYKLMPVGINPCVINRICWLFEDLFQDFLRKRNNNIEFDYSVLKSNVEYSRNDFKNIKNIYESYIDELQFYHQKIKTIKIEKDEVELERQHMVDKFKSNCEKICSNENELCDIVLDICYKTNKSKQFAWDICGEVIINNLLSKNNNTIHYPRMVKSNGEFEFGGCEFVMDSKEYRKDEKLL